MKKQEWGQWLFTSILALILSNVFVFLAVLPLRYLRLVFGRKLFILSSVFCCALLISFGMWSWVLAHVSLCLLIGFYRELEENQLSIFISAILSIGTTVMAGLVIFFSYSRITGLDTKNFLLSYFAPVLEQIQKKPHLKQINLDHLLLYFPSGLVVGLMFILFISLIGVQNSSNGQRLKNFRLPDGIIWVFIFSLALTFISLSNPTISIISGNVFIVTLGAYFFQGFAVFTHFLDRFSVFGFWRFLAYFIVFLQMLFVSGLGILDYWFDFRNRKPKTLKESVK